MEATELRIGNHVTSAHNGYGEEYIVVESITSDEINVNFRPYWIEDLNPIPLTDEWLIKLWFHKRNEKTRFVNFGFEKWTIEVDSDEYHVFHKYDKYLNTVFFVHQLQNLYHAITYQELG